MPLLHRFYAPPLNSALSATLMCCLCVPRPPLLQLTIKLCKLHKFARIYAKCLFTMNKDSDNIFIR